MIKHLKWEFHESRHAKNQLTMLFNIIQDHVNIPANEYMTPASNRTRSQHSLKFRQIPTSSDYYKFSFFPLSVCHWNSLPANVAEAPSLVSFKRELFSVSIYTIWAGHVRSSNEVLKLCWRGLCVPWCRHWEPDMLGTEECNAVTKSILFSDFLSTIFLSVLSCSLFLMQPTPAL